MPPESCSAGRPNLLCVCSAVFLIDIPGIISQGNRCKFDANAAHQMLIDAVCNIFKSGMLQSHANTTHCRECVYALVYE